MHDISIKYNMSVIMWMLKTKIEKMVGNMNILYGVL